MKVFDEGNGRRRYRCHTGNIHYPDSSRIFQNIDTTLLSQAGGFYQDKCFYSCEVPDTADGVFSFFNRDHNFDLQLQGVSAVGYKPIPNNVFGDIGVGFQYTDAFGPNIHFEVIAKNMSFEKRIRFDAPPPDITQDFYFEYEIVAYPDVATVKASMAEIGVEFDLAKSLSQATPISQKIISLLSSTGEYSSLIYFPSCYDSNPNGRKRLPVQILFYKSGNKIYLRKIIPKAIFQNAVYPIFADDPVRYDPPAGDGMIQSDPPAAWDTAHDAGTGEALFAANVMEAFSLITNSPATHMFARSYVPIDSSGIDDGYDVTAATMYIWGDSLRTDEADGNDFISIVEADCAVPAVPAADDFNKCGDSVDDPTEAHDNGDRIFINDWNLSGYNSWPFNGTGLTWVNKTGITQIGVREGHDILDDPLDTTTSWDRCAAVGYTSEQGGGATTNDPYLDVTAAPSGITGTVCWGHDASITQDNTENFTGNWTGTASIVGSGDAERFIVGPGEYMELDDPVNIGENDVVINLGDYQAGTGPAITVKYKDGTTAENCEADTWHDYSGSFTSTGYILIRVER